MGHRACTADSTGTRNQRTHSPEHHSSQYTTGRGEGGDEGRSERQPRNKQPKRTATASPAAHTARSTV